MRGGIFFWKKYFIGQMSEKKILHGTFEKNHLTFTLKINKFIAQGVKKYFHEIYFVNNIFEESFK